jgi:phosphatidate cytidylyltransferase
MLTRILTAGILIPLLLLILFFSSTVVFPIAWALLGTMAVLEMLRALGVRGDMTLTWPAYPIAAGMPFAAYFIGDVKSVWLILFGSLTFLLLWLYTVAIFRRGALLFSSIASIFTAILYITVGFLSISLLRYHTAAGKYLYLLVFIAPWVTDTFAYFTGRFFGRHKLIPEISPKKTVEGAIGGTAFGIISFIVFGVIMQFSLGHDPSYLVLGIAGALCAFISQIGDLIASLVKRERGVKDYGSIFPGHGGVMDRFDSVLATAPLLYAIFSIGGVFTALTLL